MMNEVLGGAGMNTEANDEKEHRCLIGSNIVDYIYYTIFAHRRLTGNEYVESGSIMCLARFDAFIVTVLTGQQRQERRDGYRKKVRAGTSTSHVSEPINYFTWPARKFAQIREPRHLQMPSRTTGSDSKQHRKQNILRQ